jgi:aromatic ring-opening dioxygenase catalytic subunit (LigB family)
MSLVFCGVCSHAPGITGRAERADPALREPFHAAFRAMGEKLRATRPDAVIIVAAEHFANFFMNNMPAYAMGMAESYDGPIEDADWLKIPHRVIRGNPDLSRLLIQEVQQSVDVAYAEEWRFDHGIMVPLHFLDPENELTIMPAAVTAHPCLGVR